MSSGAAVGGGAGNGGNVKRLASLACVLLARILCLFGRHRWFFQTIGDPDEVECKRCSWCRKWEYRYRFAGRGWTRWQPYEPSPEPWGPEW
jgi:hypothetical protein